MSTEVSKEITTESFKADMVVKYQELLANCHATDGFGGSPQFSAKAKEQREEGKERIEEAIAIIVAEALAVLGYETTFQILWSRDAIGSFYELDFGKVRMLEKILRHVTDNMLQKKGPDSRDEIKTVLGG